MLQLSLYTENKAFSVCGRKKISYEKLQFYLQKLVFKPVYLLPYEDIFFLNIIITSKQNRNNPTIPLSLQDRFYDDKKIMIK